MRLGDSARQIAQPGEHRFARTSYAVVLPFAGYPRAQVSDRSGRLERQLSRNIDVVVVDDGRDRHLVAGQALGVEGRWPVVTLGE